MSEIRTKIAKAIMRAFDRTEKAHGITYDPDTCYEAADEVAAVIAEELLGVEVSASFHPSVIGPARFTLGIEKLA